MHGDEKVHRNLLTNQHLTVNPNNMPVFDVPLSPLPTGDPDRAVVWYDRMIEAGFRPRYDSFFCIISGYGYIGNYNKAEEWFSKIEGAGLTLSPRCYEVLVFPLCGVRKNKPDLERAERWVAEAEERGIPPADLMNLYEVMLQGAGRAAQYKVAEKYFDKIVSSGREPTETAHRLMMIAAVRCGKNDVARGWYRRMLDAGINPSPQTLAALRMISW
eukprot:m.97226 g.97226  ORF g.97226 m.97226 type:complete len:216 (-) comp10204_c0_seq8:143-790(-)